MTIQYGPSCLGSRKLREHLKQLVPEAIPLLVKKLEADEQQTENGKERRSVRETINGLLNKQPQTAESAQGNKAVLSVFNGSLSEIGEKLALDCLHNYPPYKPYVRVFVNEDGRKILAISNAHFFPAGWPISDDWTHQIDDENDEWVYWSSINDLNLKGCPQLEYPIMVSTPSQSDKRFINLLDYDSLASMDKNQRIFVRHWFKPFTTGRNQQVQKYYRLDIDSGVEKIVDLKRFEFDREFQKSDVV